MPRQSGNRRKTLEKSGRTIWVGYLFLSLPLLIFCLLLDILIVYGWFHPDPGPFEEQLPSLGITVLSRICLVLFPVFWVAGAWMGHRFNDRWKTTIPFTAHLVVTGGFAIFFAPLGHTTRDETTPWFLYFVFLAVIMAAGLACAIVSARSSGFDKSIYDDVE